MFVSKQTSSSCTKWRLQGDDSSNGKQLHAQSRELCILLPFMKIKAEEKWPQFPPAEKERSTLLWKCAEPVTPALTLSFHGCLSGSSQRQVQFRSHRHAEAKITAQFPLLLTLKAEAQGYLLAVLMKCLGPPFLQSTSQALCPLRELEFAIALEK